MRRLVLLVVLPTIGMTSVAQNPDVAKPPPILNSAGQFRARRLSQPPTIDGRAWIATEVETTSDPGPVPVPTHAFSLSLTDCGDHRGDFERCQLLFRRRKSAPIPISDGYTGWVFVTPDARYVITEPLYVLDVPEWKQYALFEVMQIPNYTNIAAISRDGRRLIISRRDCAMDCRGIGVDVEYFELTLP